MSSHVTITRKRRRKVSLEANVFNPVIVYNVLQSCRLLATAAERLTANLGAKLGPNREHIAENLAKSLMLVTALHPRIGYDKAVKIGKTALAERHAEGRRGEAGRPAARDLRCRAVPAAMTAPGAALDGGGG